MIRVLLAFLLAAAPLHAHDLWLIPPEKAAAKEQIVILVNQGMDFPKSTNAANVKAAAKSFVVVPGGEMSDLEALAAEGKSARLGFTPTREGLHVIAMETSPKRLAMEAAEFNAYLVSDGMPHIFKVRHDEGSLNQSAKEQYRKSVKTIVRVGSGDTGEFDKSLGLPLEIMPLANPLTRKVGQTLAVRVLFQGKPLPDVNLGWSHPGDGESPRGTIRTNAKGEALIPIAKTDLMTIRLTHMTHPKAIEYEWESFWTTLTFRIEN